MESVECHLASRLSLFFLRTIGSGKRSNKRNGQRNFYPHDTNVEMVGFFGFSWMDGDILRDQNWTMGRRLYDYQLPMSHLPEYHLVLAATKLEHRNRNLNPRIRPLEDRKLKETWGNDFEPKKKSNCKQR